MPLPRTLEMFNTFVDGKSFVGECLELKLPTIAMKTEDYRGAGMQGIVKLLKGLEAIELEHTYNGPIKELVATFGAPKHDATMIRWVGSYSKEDDGSTQAVEIVVRGRNNSFDPGDAKSGENGSWKTKTDCTYFKLTVDGTVWLEIDIVNQLFVVMGADRLAEHRSNIGL